MGHLLTHLHLDLYQQRISSLPSKLSKPSQLAAIAMLPCWMMWLVMVNYWNSTCHFPWMTMKNHSKKRLSSIEGVLEWGYPQLSSIGKLVFPSPSGASDWRSNCAKSLFAFSTSLTSSSKKLKLMARPRRFSWCSKPRWDHSGIPDKISGHDMNFMRFQGIFNRNLMGCIFENGGHTVVYRTPRTRPWKHGKMTTSQPSEVPNFRQTHMSKVIQKQMDGRWW